MTPLSSPRAQAWRRLALFFFLVVLGSALLAPLLSQVVTALHGQVPAHRLMDRALLVSALLSLLILGVPWSQLWPRQVPFLRQIGTGFLLAAISAQAILGLALVLSARVFYTDATLGHQIAVAVGAALLVPFLEETLFRGFFLRNLTLVVPSGVALVLSALLFSLVHFLRAPASLQLVHLGSGFTAWGQMGPEWTTFLSVEGLNLFFIGLILGWLYLQTRNLWLNYGLHGGWVFFLLLMNAFLRVNGHPYPPVAFLCGTYLLSSGYVTLVLLLLFYWLWRFFPAFKPGLGISPTAP